MLRWLTDLHWVPNTDELQAWPVPHDLVTLEPINANDPPRDPHQWMLAHGRPPKCQGAPQGPLVLWPCVARWGPPVARFGLLWPDSASSGQKEPTSRQPDFRFPILNTCHAHDTAHDTAQQPFFLASTPPWTGHCPPHCTLLIMCFKSKGSVRALHHTFTCASDWIASAGCSALPHVQHCWANAGTVQARVHSALQVQQPKPLLF